MPDQAQECGFDDIYEEALARPASGEKHRRTRMTQSTTIIHPFLPTGPEAVRMVIDELGAIAFPVMSEADALYLSETAKRRRYKRQPRAYGKRKVRQDVASCKVLPGDVQWEVADQLERDLGRFFGPEAFESPLTLSHRNIQRYKHGTYGIGRHRDESINRNLVVLLTLRGTGRFTVYESLGGSILTRWTLRPGVLLIMQAPGFYGSTKEDRPVHSVDQITGDPYRYLLGLRQQVVA